MQFKSSPVKNKEIKISIMCLKFNDMEMHLITQSAASMKSTLTR